MAGTKRKSDVAPSGSTSKKARQVDYTNARSLIEDVISSGGKEVSESDALVIAQYARHLEESISALKPKEKSPAEIEAAAEKLRNASVSGIKKQMSWKPSCKTGGAKWSFDGVCADPVIFGAMLNLEGPPKWKAHKYTVNEFQDIMGTVEASVRYDSLELMGNVNVKYDAQAGTFKMSGTYGAPRHIKD